MHSAGGISVGEWVGSVERPSLPLTGERTVPGVARENYWFRRHEAAYVWAVATLATTTAGAILEAGCGEGYGADLLARSLNRPVLAVDYDEAACAHAARTYPSISVARANLAALPCFDARCAAAVSMQVVEHLWDVRGFLATLRSTLRPGAVAIVSTPNRLTFSPGLARGDKPTNPFHVEEFDAQQLAQLMNGAGFTDVRVYGLHHGRRLMRDEEDNGSIVSAQIDAILTDTWSAQLDRRVSAVTTDDFVVGEATDSSLDLLVTGVRP